MASRSRSRSPSSRGRSAGCAAPSAPDRLAARHIVAGHRNKELHDDAERTIAETRRYVDDAQARREPEKPGVDFLNAKLEHYPNHLGGYVRWAGAQTLRCLARCDSDGAVHSH